MAKGSGSTRTQTGNSNVFFDKGSFVLANKTGNDPEITEYYKDFFLPDSFASKYAIIDAIVTYEDLGEYLKKNNIQLNTDYEAYKNAKNENLKRSIQNIVSGIEAYKSIFGANSMKKLKVVKLGDKYLNEAAAYHYNEVGENDPLAGTIRIRDLGSDAHAIYHELAHALQASYAKRNESATSYASRKIKEIGGGTGAYFGSTSSTRDAESFAESIAYGITGNSKEGRDFIYRLRKNKR